jgi:serine/threonine-protein kinase
MGAVYRALDPLIEREVAIKTLLPNLPEDVMAEVRERFLREARSAGRLNHPNIVTIFDVGEQDGMAYIAMELLEGRSLQRILRESGRLAYDLVADIAAQVADALDFAQRSSIVHRDVKPANVMIDPMERAKLMDFGVAYVPSSTMTQAGTSLGSPRYMSPEQVMGMPVDPRADIFSLGVVLYEMLARRTPFENAGDTTVFPLMNRIAAAPHLPLRQVDPRIPEAFERIVDPALAKKPAERYQRAGEMAAELRRLGSLASAPAAVAAPAAGGPPPPPPGTRPGPNMHPQTSCPVPVRLSAGRGRRRSGLPPTDLCELSGSRPGPARPLRERAAPG